MQSNTPLIFLPCTGLGTGAPIIESPYGDSIQPDEAPESISRAVASLPPEQMFELMKQMKVGLALNLIVLWLNPSLYKLLCSRFDL